MSDAQLAMVVQSESVDLVFRVDIERVVVATKDVTDVFSVDFFHAQGLVVLVSGFKHPADLTALWVAPAVNFTCGS